MTGEIRLRRSLRLCAYAVAGGALIPIAMTSAPASARTCDGLPASDRLDFWVGEWHVDVGGQRVGENRIEKILSGCAVMEYWRDAAGSEGRSLFYYVPAEHTWKQVWVTANATAPGGLKEKTMISEGVPAGSVRFQGTVKLPDGRSYQDRTTLTPLDGGRVRQLIEISTDGGVTWEGRFDGLYSPRQQGSDEEADASARRVLERALAAIGGEDAIRRAGGLVLEGEGEWDLGVRLQGVAPFEAERQPLVERLAIDASPQRTVYETRSPINPDADEWLRYDHREDVSYVVDLLGRRAFRVGGSGRARIERAVPHLLLAEALSQRESLRDRGETGARRTVEWQTPEDITLTLHFEARDHLLREVSYTTEMPVRGEAQIMWRFDGYAEIERLGRYPRGYTIEVDGEPVRRVTYTRVAAGDDSDLFEAVADIAYPEPRPPAASSSAPQEAESEEEEFDIRELAAGVYLLANVRGGFHVLWVEFDDFVLAVDAPAQWLELQELPATLPGGSATAVGERYLRAIRSRVPDKPVRYVALTHHHDDHAGGVGAFVDAGATVLAAPETRPVVEAVLERTDLPFEAVRGEHTIADATMEVRLIDVGPNPHAEGMLAVYLPRHDLLYVSDLFEPISDASFPNPSRVPVMRWFVDWLDASGLDPERVYAVHGRATVTAEQIERIRALPRDGGDAPRRPSLSGSGAP